MPRSSQKKCRSLLAAVVLAFFSLWPAILANAAEKTPEITFEDPVVSVPVLQTAAWTDDLIVRVKGNSQPPLLVLPEGSSVKKGGDPYRDPGQAELWYVPVTVPNVLPANTVFRYEATVSAGAAKGKLYSFWVTNREPALSIIPSASSWRIDISEESQSSCTPIRLHPGEVPATGVQLLRSTLVDETSKRPLGSNLLRLCGANPCQSEQPLSLPASLSTPAWICLRDTFDGYGEFKGSLVFGTQQKPAGQTIELTIYRTSCLLRWAGFGLIVLGILVGWWLRNLSRSRLDRLQALAPAAFLYGQLTALERQLEDLFPGSNTPPAKYLPRIWRKISDLELSLIDDRLETLHYIPPKLPSPFGSPLLNSAGYASFLKDQSDSTAMLRVLIKEGAVEVMKRRESAPGELIVKALKDLDDILLLSPLPSPEQARSKVEDILAQIDERMEMTRAALKAQSPAAPSTFEEVQIQIGRWSVAAWLAWGAITALAGLAAMILPDPGFGTWLDLVLCFLWGLGITTVLTQLNLGAVGSVLGISLVRP